MTYRTEQDKINRKEANQRYYKLEENKQQKRDYMKEYQRRNYVKDKAHEKYIQKKIEEAQLDISNDNLHADNSERFIDGAQE
jgi:DNA replication protein DnaC